MRAEISASRSAVYLQAAFFLGGALAFAFLDPILLPLAFYSGIVGLVWLSLKQVSLDSDGFVVTSSQKEERIPFSAVHSISTGSILGPYFVLKIHEPTGRRRIRFFPEPSQGNFLTGRSKLLGQLRELVSAS